MRICKHDPWDDEEEVEEAPDREAEFASFIHHVKGKKFTDTLTGSIRTLWDQNWDLKQENEDLRNRIERLEKWVDAWATMARPEWKDE